MATRRTRACHMAVAHWRGESTDRIRSPNSSEILAMKQSNGYRYAIFAMAAAAMSAGTAALAQEREHHQGHGGTATPIKHVIVVVGENHTFDNLFGGFTPRPGQHVHNLLSEGIINADGTPGPHF